MKPIALSNLSSVFRKLLFALIMLMIPYVHAFCQEKIGVIKLSPQHFIASTLKVDLERSYGSHSSFILSPSLTGFDKGDEKVIGGGLEIAKRYYVLNADECSLNGFYANVSLSYNYFDVWYEKKSYPQNYNYRDSIPTKEFKEKIHQLGGDFVFGYQVSIKEVFFVDMYFGGGMRIGMSSLGKDSYYRSVMLDYAYNGIIPKAGIKAGLKIR